MGRRGWLVVGMLLLILGVPCKSFAIGTQQTLRGEDLQIEIDSRWCGCRYGGIYPVRVEIINSGRARNITVRMSNRNLAQTGSAVVERRIRVEEGSTRKFTLPVPMVDESSGGPLQVLVDGEANPQLSINVSLAPLADPYDNSPEMLVISTAKPSLAVYGMVAEHIGRPAAVHTGFPTGRSTSETHAEVVEPVSLPESWTDYSGLDLVAVSLESWQGKDFSEAAREAILKWVAAGGTLIIHGVGGPAKDSKDLLNRLQLGNRAAVSADWMTAKIEDRYNQQVKWGDFRNHGEQPFGGSGRKSDELEERSWLRQTAAAPFEARDLQLGRVYAMASDPFPGTLDDWGWLLNHLGEKNYKWTLRYGNNHRQPTAKFGEFSIPHVGEVPAKMFIALISVFTLVIGPLNYFVLSRRRQLYLLLITIPLFAAITSVSLFGYAIVADGLDVKARLRSVTFLDQRNHEAVSLTRAGYYAGLSPWGGMKFSTDTLVMPIWPRGEEPSPASVDWTDDQHLSSSWLRSRTPTQFAFRSQRVERGRLEVSAEGGNSETLQVANGFSWDIDEIMVRDKADKIYYGQNLRAGGTTTLTPASHEVRLRFANKITSRISLDETNAPNPWNQKFEVRTRHHGMRGHSPWEQETVQPIEYGESQGERLLRDLYMQTVTESAMPQQTYIVTTSQSPGLDIGLSNVSEVAPLHVVYGRY